MGAKLLEILQQILPGLSRVAVLFESESAPSVEDFQAILAAAQSVRIQAQAVAVASTDDFAAALDGALDGRPQALILATLGPVLAVRRRAIAEFTLKHGLLSVSEVSTWAGFGGLMSYGPDDPAMYRRAGGYYVDRILRGAKPAELPVEQPTVFDFIVNRTTAQAIGITIPAELAAQVTEWVE